MLCLIRNTLILILCWGLVPPCPVAKSASLVAGGERPALDAARKGVPAGLKRIAYFETGPYWEFSLIREKVMGSLDRLQVLDQVEFPESLHVSPGWGADSAVYLAEARRLMADPSVDLIMSMGTVATKALLAENNERTPIVSIDVADPVGAGIIDAETGRGAVNLTLEYTRDKWQKVFVLFHEALPFDKLGIMYHDSPEGRSYSNVNEAREVARDRGFTLVEYAGLDQEESAQSCVEGVRSLISQGVDAFYISALNCFDWTKENPRKIFDALHEQGIKTFARDGSVQVRQGALMGLSTLDYAPLGDFYAGRMARLLGFVPESVPLVEHRYSPKITLNLDTARELNLDVPLVLLITADEIFDSSLAPIRIESGAK
jgi:ABC-type uncharacterized transport system substrate-binding protein